LEKYSYARYPALQTLEGIIFSSNTILRYFARKGKNMYGKNLM
jgi:glutathione S-transferase